MGFEKRSAFDQGFVDGYEAYMEKASGVNYDMAKNLYNYSRAAKGSRLGSFRIAARRYREDVGKDISESIKKHPKKYMAVGGAAAAGGGYAAGRLNSR